MGAHFSLELCFHRRLAQRLVGMQRCLVEVCGAGQQQYCGLQERFINCLTWTCVMLTFGAFCFFTFILFMVVLQAGELAFFATCEWYRSFFVTDPTQYIKTACQPTLCVIGVRKSLSRPLPEYTVACDSARLLDYRIPGVMFYSCWFIVVCSYSGYVPISTASALTHSACSHRLWCHACANN